MVVIYKFSKGGFYLVELPQGTNRYTLLHSGNGSTPGNTFHKRLQEPVRSLKSRTHFKGTAQFTWNQRRSLWLWTRKYNDKTKESLTKDNTCDYFQCISKIVHCRQLLGRMPICPCRILAGDGRVVARNEARATSRGIYATLCKSSTCD